MAYIDVTVKNFDEEVLKSDRPVLVDLWATWCGPCRMLAPTIEKIANEHPEIKVCKVNVDEESDIAIRYHVSAIPTVLAFKNGQLAGRSVGFVSEETILNTLK